MFTIWMVVMLGFQSDAPAPKASKEDAWKRFVDIRTSASSTDAKGHQRIIVQMKIKPNFHIYGRPVPDEIKDSELRLKARTKDPKTRIEITYPKGIAFKELGISWTEHQGDIELYAIVERAKGDDSSIECELFFGGNYRRAA